MTTTQQTTGPQGAAAFTEAARATAEASRQTLQSTQNAMRLSREVLQQSADASRKLFAAYAAGVTTGIKTTFDAQNAALAAELSVVETTGIGNRQVAAQFMETV